MGCAKRTRRGRRARIPRRRSMRRGGCRWSWSRPCERGRCPPNAFPPPALRGKRLVLMRRQRPSASPDRPATDMASPRTTCHPFSPTGEKPSDGIDFPTLIPCRGHRGPRPRPDGPRTAGPPVARGACSRGRPGRTKSESSSLGPSRSATPPCAPPRSSAARERARHRPPFGIVQVAALLVVDRGDARRLGSVRACESEYGCGAGDVPDAAVRGSAGRCLVLGFEAGHDLS